MKLLLIHDGQGGAGASWSEASLTGGMGAAVVWQPHMRKTDQDDLQELKGGREGRPSGVKIPCYASVTATVSSERARHQVANVE